jgi:hypothetical protein
MRDNGFGPLQRQNEYQNCFYLNFGPRKEAVVGMSDVQRSCVQTVNN